MSFCERFRMVGAKGCTVEVNTMKLVIATAAFAATMAYAVPAARAYGDAPWCAVIELGTGNVQWQCEYNTVEECVPNVLAGNRGFCNVNPYWRGPAAEYGKHYRRGY
jgi:hypothetical protein